nr:aprataxin-like protein [Quercus suber]
MSPKKPKPVPQSTDEPTRQTVFHRRDGLAAYTTDPTSFPPSRVVYHNDKFVVINDLYPKAAVHLLILPRDTKRNVMSPQAAFDDPQFLADCQAEEKKVRMIVANELRRKFGSLSTTDRPRLEAMDAEDPPDVLPSGRDWDKDIISGIHANPSMNHVHIHVLSRDMVSDCMKKRNHYQSFTTDFLVALDQFPLAEDDYRRSYGCFPPDMICWRCGKNFENKMTKLLGHLQKEAEEWKRE